MWLHATAGIRLRPPGLCSKSLTPWALSAARVLVFWEGFTLISIAAAPVCAQLWWIVSFLYPSLCFLVAVILTGMRQSQCSFNLHVSEGQRWWTPLKTSRGHLYYFLRIVYFIGPFSDWQCRFWCLIFVVLYTFQVSVQFLKSIWQSFSPSL